MPESPRIFAVSGFVELISALAAVLDARGARWYLFGAQAVVLWGSPRMTADVDATAEITPAEAPALLSEMAAAGFAVRVPDPLDFVARTRVLPFLHRPSQLPLDLVLAGPGLEEQFLARARLVPLSTFKVPVISPEDLIVTKILAGRPKDIEDVRGILRRQRQKLNLDQIASTLALLEQALERGDLRPLLAAQLAAVDEGDS